MDRPSETNDPAHIGQQFKQMALKPRIQQVYGERGNGHKRKMRNNILETKIMLNSKKKIVDLTEVKLFKTRKRKAADQKTQKYLTKLSQGMGTIQQEIFHDTMLYVN